MPSLPGLFSGALKKQFNAVPTMGTIRENSVMCSPFCISRRRAHARLTFHSKFQFDLSVLRRWRKPPSAPYVICRQPIVAQNVGMCTIALENIKRLIGPGIKRTAVQFTL